MRKWLVTAFEPFGKIAQNSSWLVLEGLRALDWNGQVEFFAPVPVRFEGAFKSLEPRLTGFDGVLALGQAEGRARIGLERLALNFKDARIPDNAGVQPHEARVSVEGPEVWWTDIDWPKLLGRHPRLELSYSAGTYVCNTLYYELLQWADAHKKQAGFVHIPLLESQGVLGFSSLKDEDAVQALTEVLKFLVQKPPLKVVAGLILNERGEVLLAERLKGKHLAGLWEFPGGKLERGETREQALKRELQEELQLDVRIENDLGNFVYSYAENEVELSVFIVHALGVPQTTASVQHFRWCRPDDIDLAQLAPADHEPLRRFLMDVHPG